MKTEKPKKQRGRGETNCLTTGEMEVGGEGKLRKQDAMVPQFKRGKEKLSRGKKPREPTARQKIKGPIFRQHRNNIKTTGVHVGT